IFRDRPFPSREPARDVGRPEEGPISFFLFLSILKSFVPYTRGLLRLCHQPCPLSLVYPGTRTEERLLNYTHIFRDRGNTDGQVLRGWCCTNPFTEHRLPGLPSFWPCESSYTPFPISCS